MTKTSALAHEAQQDLARLGVLQIERDAALAAAGQQPAVVLLALRKRRHLVQVAVGIPRLRRLDLHHVGAEVGHHRRGGGAEDEAADVEHANAFEDGAHGDLRSGRPILRRIAAKVRRIGLESAGLASVDAGRHDERNRRRRRAADVEGGEAAGALDLGLARGAAHLAAPRPRACARRSCPPDGRRRSGRPRDSPAAGRRARACPSSIGLPALAGRRDAEVVDRHVLGRRETIVRLDAVDSPRRPRCRPARTRR